MNDRIALGKRGEEIAARHLSGRGARILARNFACTCGELDIIAVMGESVLFVEVKSRIGESGLIQALGRRQIARLKRMARIFLRQAGLCGKDYGFWVVYVLFSDPADRTPRLITVENPF